MFVDHSVYKILNELIIGPASTNENAINKKCNSMACQEVCKEDRIICTKTYIFWLVANQLRWQGGISANVTKNAILGYSHDWG